MVHSIRIYNITVRRLREGSCVDERPCPHSRNNAQMVQTLYTAIAEKKYSLIGVQGEKQLLFPQTASGKGNSKGKESFLESKIVGWIIRQTRKGYAPMPRMASHHSATMCNSTDSDSSHLYAASYSSRTKILSFIVRPQCGYTDVTNNHRTSLLVKVSKSVCG